MPGSHLANKQLMVLNGVSYTQELLSIHTCTQAVISCFSGDKARGNMVKIQESQLLQALEYFNLPESMWPLGLYIRHTHELHCNQVAKHMMTTDKADFSKMAKQDSERAAFTKSYSVYNSQHGLYLKALGPCSASCGLSSISEPLKCRLRDLAAAECLAIEFYSHLGCRQHVSAEILSANLSKL